MPRCYLTPDAEHNFVPSIDIHPRALNHVLDIEMVNGALTRLGQVLRDFILT